MLIVGKDKNNIGTMNGVLRKRQTGGSDDDKSNQRCLLESAHSVVFLNDWRVVSATSFDSHDVPRLNRRGRWFRGEPIPVEAVSSANWTTWVRLCQLSNQLCNTQDPLAHMKDNVLSMVQNAATHPIA